MRNHVATARSMLFVPGNRSERFEKAAGSDTDAIVLDLEDAVSPSHKTEARHHVRAWLESGHQAVIRINGIGTDWFSDDVAALSRVAEAVMLPKACSAADIRTVREHFGPATVVVPLIETAAGLLHAHETLQDESVVRAAFGTLDLAAELGVAPHARDALLHARSTLVLASAAAGCAAPLDGVTSAVNDTELLAADTEHAAELGFSGKLCIHPRQISTVHRLLAPSESELKWAGEIVAAAEGDVTVHNGAMVDLPVIARARRLLERRR